MQADPTSTRIEELLIHQEWIQRLARSLVADPDAASDIVQETWLAALRNPPRLKGPPRAWLARFALNFARQRGPGEARRSWREAEIRRREASVPSAQILAERAETQRLLVERVLNLSEPFRSTVLLRYFGGLTSLEIGERQSVPPGTVRWRLKRALERLRYELDNEFKGDPEVGVLALVALAGLKPDDILEHDSNGSSLAALSSEMQVGIGMSAAALLASGLLVWWAIGMTGDPPPLGLAGASGMTEEPSLENAGSSAPVRESLAPTGSTRSPDAPLIRQAGAFDVRVIDQTGLPLATAAVWATRHTAEGRAHELRGYTDDAGLFVFLPDPSDLGAPLDFPDSGGRVTLGALAAGHIASDFLHALPAEPETVREALLVVGADDHTLLGIVQDPGGAPIAGARVAVGESGLRTRENEWGDLLTSPVLEAVTGPDGIFRIAHLPEGRHLVDVEAHGFLTSATWRETSALLTPAPLFLQPAGAVAGTLRDAGGRPLAGVAVDHRPDSLEHARFRQLRTTGKDAHVRTRADGTYRLNGVPPGQVNLWARATDGRAALGRIQVRAGEVAEWSPTISAHPGLCLQLIGPDGEPLSGWYMQVEGHGAYTRRSRTDREGRTTLLDPPGDRIRIFAHAPRTARRSNRLPLRGGELRAPYQDENVIQLESLTVPGSVSGSLVDWSGVPFADAQLFARIQGRGDVDRVLIDRLTGRFDITDVPPGKLELLVWCDGLGLTNLGTFDAAAAHLDVGPLTPSPPGRLEVDWPWPDGGGDLEWRLIARARIGQKATLWAIAEGFGAPPDFDLLPGDYGMRVLRRGEVVQERLATVSSGGEAQLITGPGIGRQVHVRLRERGGRTMQSARLTVRPLSGGLGPEKQFVLERPEIGRIEHVLDLPAGVWLFEASSVGGLRGSAQLEVTDGSSLERLVIHME